MVHESAQALLRRQVLEAGSCTLCGACSGLCPYLKPFQGRIVAIDSCSFPAGTGRCFSFCPRVGTNLDRLHQGVFGAPYTGEPLGSVRRVLMARSSNPDIRRVAQYGGTVTALVCHALERGMAQSAILTRTVEGIPRSVSVTNAREVLECSGSTYLASPILETVNRTTGKSSGALAFVGTPCQVTGFRKMFDSPLGPGSGNGGQPIVVGLFCTWALGHSFLKLLEQAVPSGQIKKMDIPPPPAQRFDIETQDGQVSLPLDDVRPHILEACTLCPDMTAELADVSVGSAEGIPGWTTLLVRTEQGEKLVQQALDEGILEAAELPAENLAHLQEASANKRLRVFRRLSEQSGSVEDLGYLQVNLQATRRVLEG